MLTFPKEYIKDLNKAIAIYYSVEKTHKGLGKLAVMDSLSDLANRCLMVIGASGTGKSVISDAVYDIVGRSKLKPDAITVQGLRHIEKVLSFNALTVIIDDLSKGQTEYSQMATVSVFSSLCYTGSIKKFTGSLCLQINDFVGCAIINLQPLLLRKIARLNEFETDIRDKVIRWYHLRFPIQENITRPALDKTVKWQYLKTFNLSFNSLTEKDTTKAFNNFRYEFSRARAREHLTAYLNASACLNHRTVIRAADVWLIEELSKNFRIEPYILTKQTLEGARELDENVLPMLSALATYHNPKVQELCYRFGIKRSRMYEILSTLIDYAILAKNRGMIIPTKATVKLLKEVGEW